MSKDYTPLTDDVYVTQEENDPIQVSLTSVQQMLRKVCISRANGPDKLPNWVLKIYADILAPAITDILNCSFCNCTVPQAWKMADVSSLKHRK